MGENLIPVIGFWHEYEENGCFSNWYPAEIDYAGVHFMNSEQYLMYHKVLMFHQYDLAEQIMANPDLKSHKSVNPRP